jgi:hypothetical protein
VAEYPDLNVVFDCADPDRVAQFRMVALPGYDVPPPPGGHPTWQEWQTPTTFARINGI